MKERASPSVERDASFGWAAVSFAAVDPTLKATVFRPYVHVRDGDVIENSFASLGDFLTPNYVSGVVPNPVIRSVPSHDRRVEVVEPRWHRLALVPIARLCVKKDRSHFCAYG